MTFATPWVLLLLLALPVIAWRLVRPGRATSAAAVFSDFRLLGGLRFSLRTNLARWLPWLRLPALLLLILALARPQAMTGIREIGGAGIDIMLVLDISGSMKAEDFRPKNRFTVAREVLREFIEQAGANRLGLVVFASQAFTQCPLAADHKIVSQLLERVQQGMVGNETAIGSAIATAANRLLVSKARSKVIILLTDGVNNRGEIDPLSAAQAAGQLGIKIYAIGVGKQGGAATPMLDPVLGNQYARDQYGRLLVAKLDEETLKSVAAKTGGQYFRATDADTLRKIYEQIDKMEKSEYTGRRERQYKELYASFLLPGIILLLIQFVLGATWLRKAP